MIILQMSQKRFMYEYANIFHITSLGVGHKVSPASL